MPIVGGNVILDEEMRVISYVTVEINSNPVKEIRERIG
jgi:hypothetical protein